MPLYAAFSSGEEVSPIRDKLGMFQGATERGDAPRYCKSSGTLSYEVDFRQYELEII
jgi:hypothetical protein